MNILVTGATGFLGKTLCRQLRRRSSVLVELGSRDADLTYSASLLAFNRYRYDRIYHLAAWTRAGDFCLKHPGEQWLINQKINTNVLSWWAQHQPQATLISIGTSCAYDPNLPLAEENYLKGEPIDSLYTYAMTKRMMQAGLQAMHRQFGLNYLTVVPSTLYGGGYHADGRPMHFIFDLVRKILRGKTHGEPVTLWGDGHQQRELIHVEDFTRLLLAVEDRCANEIVNIGAGREQSIRQYAAEICRQVGYDFNAIRFDESQYTGARSKCLEIAKLRSLVGDPNPRPLEIGLAETIDWLRQDHSAFRISHSAFNSEAA
jgi:GDP-L-fucose synthase